MGAEGGMYCIILHENVSTNSESWVNVGSTLPWETCWDGL